MPTMIEEFGVTRLASSRLAGRRFGLALMAGSAIAVAILAVSLPAGNVVAVAGALVGADALILGFAQYRAQRQENSIDRLYDRLNLANERRLDYERVRPDRAELYRGPDALPGETQESQSVFVTLVFTEIDNLEYAIEKYRHGFCSKALANRSLRTFWDRLKDQRFRNTVNGIYENAAYAEGTCRVVAAMLRKLAADC